MVTILQQFSRLMSQYREVGLSEPRVSTFTDAEHQRPSRFFAPQRPRRVNDTRDDSPFTNSYCTGSIEKNHEACFIHYPLVPFTKNQDGRDSPASSLNTRRANIGRRRERVAALIASPPRASHSVKVSRIFQDARTNLVNASRKGLSLQESPSPKLSTSKHRRTFGAQHPPPTFCREDAVTKTPESWKLLDSQPPQFSTIPQPFAELHSSQTNSRRSPLAMALSRPFMEQKAKLTPIDTSIPQNQTPPIYDTVVKSKPESDSPKLPPIQSLGDLFSDVAALIGPPNPQTPPCEMRTEQGPATSSLQALAPQDTVLYSPTGTWSDDHTFFRGPPKKLRVPQSPFSQAWTDDSKFYTGPLPVADTQPEPAASQSTEETVLTWLDKVNPNASEGSLSLQSAQPFNTNHTAIGGPANATNNKDTSAEGVTPSDQSSGTSHSMYGSPLPKYRRSNSTCSSPPRVDSGSETPPLSPLSPDVAIERGKRKRERSRTASYYDEDILKTQEELRKKEERRKARLQKYGC